MILCDGDLYNVSIIVRIPSFSNGVLNQKVSQSDNSKKKPLIFKEKLILTSLVQLKQFF
jgi:hypothetical protein